MASRNRRAAFGLGALAAVWMILSGSAVARSDGEPLRVATTFTILQDMARNVAGEHAEVVSITKPGAEIHDYDPTPRDIVAAQRADLVLWNGLGLERWFERFFSGIDDVPSVVLSDGVAPLGIGEGPYAGRPNPHAWMSPTNAAIYVENIRKALTAHDPANAAAYARNAAAYRARLEALARPIAARLESIPDERRRLVTCEGAFSYLARDYGLHEHFLWAVNSEEEGTPQQVRGVVDLVRDVGVPVVFCESTVSDKAMRQVADETGARFGGTLYVDSLTASDGPAPTFLELLEYNARVIQRGFDVAS